jgi:primosomal protein N' (replication factor Y)
MLPYYRSSVGAITQTLLPPTIPKRASSQEVTTTPANQTQALPELNSDQTSACSAIVGAGSYLLHGRTGSGKTRIYQELARRQVEQGRSVLVLSPEIGLTSQLVQSFQDLGVAPVFNQHSGLTGRNRYDIWQQLLARRGASIVIGARSALFSPLQDIGLIIVDEFHETAYKQEQEPRYQATRTAAVLAKLHGAILVYGSATPSVVDYRLAEETNASILTLDNLAVQNNVVAKTEIIDLKQRQNFNRSNILSTPLIEAAELSLQRKEQVMLYLNRRGTARVSLCQNCGWQAVCERCDLPLTYHGDDHKLRCHTCSTAVPTPSSCPVCHNAEIIFRGVGTKAVVEEAGRLFPKAKIVRFDSDNTSAETLQQTYSDVKNGGADIIVGTQTLAKGLDLPLLSTLGVVTADSSLQIPDFTANERTFQLISQVLGRVQRGHRGSIAVIQTYNPDSPVLQAAITQDWANFYNTELTERRQFHFPPFCHLLTIRCRRATAASAERTCLKIITTIKSLGLAIEVEGPAPALHERSPAGYTWQVIVKAAARKDLLTVVDSLPSTVTSYDLDPANLL